MIEAVGTGATFNLKKGDRVYLTGSSTGTYAQFAVANASDCRILPPFVTFGQGAAVNVAFRTAYRALFVRGGGKSGSTVFVHGASGGVGVASVQLAVAAGMKVIGSAGSPAGLSLIEQMGAVAVDHTSSDCKRMISCVAFGEVVVQEGMYRSPEPQNDAFFSSSN